MRSSCTRSQHRELQQAGGAEYELAGAAGVVVAVVVVVGLGEITAVSAGRSLPQFSGEPPPKQWPHWTRTRPELSARTRPG